MSCLQKERKPMVPLKTLQIIFRRRHLQNTQYYFANRKHAVSPDKVKIKPGKSYRVPRSEKLVSYIKYSDHKEKLEAKARLSQPLHLKDNLKIAATRDISQRLYLEEPPDDVKAVVEIHPEFYTVIEGRPLRSFDDIKVYTNNIRKYAMDRQQIGYRRDLILKIQQATVEESSEFQRISKELKQHIANFQKFLTEDYKKACAKVAKAEKMYDELVAKNAEFLGYISQMTMINNIMFKLDAIRGVLKMYRTYLLFVAPLSWRQKNDESLRGKVHSIQFEEGEFVTDNDLVETLDIYKTAELARNELRNPLPANIYFEYPEQMLYIFRTMELQSREYLIQLSKTDLPYKLILSRIKQLNQVTKQELDYFQYYIDTINNDIGREYFNEKYLKDKFFHLLNETFYETVASPQTLKLKICIEYVYEQIFGKCDEGHQTLLDPMKILEVMYEEYNLRLDALDFNVVKQAQSDFFSNDLKMMKNAYAAERELKAFREMTNAMNKAFLPPREYRRPTFTKFLDKKSKLAKLRAEKNKLEAASGELPKLVRKFKLTPEEQDGLILFTDWCEGQNPGPFLKEYYTFVKPTFEWAPRKSIVP